MTYFDIQQLFYHVLVIVGSHCATSGMFMIAFMMATTPVLREATLFSKSNKLVLHES